MGKLLPKTFFAQVGITNLAIPTWYMFQSQGDLLAFFVPESAQGNTDLNGDGDADDFVLHVADLAVVDVRELIEALTADVLELELPQGLENGLVAKLDEALKILGDENENNDGVAINKLNDFIDQVEGNRGEKISEADADALIAAAQDIIARLNGA